jgi:hypothetical protein
MMAAPEWRVPGRAAMRIDLLGFFLDTAGVENVHCSSNPVGTAGKTL